MASALILGVSVRTELDTFVTEQEPDAEWVCLQLACTSFRKDFTICVQVILRVRFLKLETMEEARA